MNHETFKELMSGVPAPVTVVTTTHQGAPKGATVSSFSSLSLDPPLVSIALAETSNLLGHLRENGRFGINLLAHDQADLALQFSASVSNRFDGVAWSSNNGLPRLAGAARYLECVLESDVRGGDHATIFGRVIGCNISDRPPLIYVGKRFGTHSSYCSVREEPALADQAS